MIPIIKILRREYRNRLQDLPRQLLRMLRQEAGHPAPVRRPQQRHEFGAALAGQGASSSSWAAPRARSMMSLVLGGDDVVFEL